MSKLNYAVVYSDCGPGHVFTGWDVQDEQGICLTAMPFKTKKDAEGFIEVCQQGHDAAEANDRYWGSLYESAGDRSEGG
jgi:hypothetical protein